MASTEDGRVGNCIGADAWHVLPYQPRPLALADVEDTHPTPICADVEAVALYHDMPPVELLSAAT